MPSWYGWIPILSGKLFPPEEEDVEERAERLQKEINENEKYDIDHTHERLNKWKIKLRTKREKLQVDCELEESGLCKITVVDGGSSYDNILAIYRFIRDIYHKHIHHSGDLPLRPIEGNDENDAIEGNLDQYRQKVRDYHQEAKDFIDSGKFDDAVDIISSGRGEMQYAKSFVNLFVVGEQREALIRVFENADKSLEVLMQRVTWPSLIEKRFPLIAMLLLVFLSALSVLSSHLGLWLGSVISIALLIALIISLIPLIRKIV